jgi:cobalt-zinc-cadmium efflux system protein
VSPGHRHRPGRALIAALALTLGFAGVEALAGWFAGSLALLSDAGHMLTDSLALAIATVAARLSHRAPSPRHSYGLARAEVLAALANAGFVFALVLGIAWNALARLWHPQPVDGDTVSIVAALGLAINLAVAWTLSRGGRDLNTRAALLHVMIDALGSVAALASGLVILATGWTRIDPLLSIAICALILGSSLRLAREAVHTLLEGVPPGISLPRVGQRMARVAGVASVHDLHIWSISSQRAALSAHLVVRDLADWEGVRAALERVLRTEFGIDHVTLQPETRTPRIGAVDADVLKKTAPQASIYH